MRRRTLLQSLAAGGVLAGAGTFLGRDLLQSQDSEQVKAAQGFPTKQVWGHMVPQGLPDYAETDGARYGTDRPLDLVAGDWTSKARTTGGIHRAIASGLTGMQLLQYEGYNKGSDYVTEWLSMADPTWDNSQSGFGVAPCIAASTPAGVSKMITEYAAAATGHASAARVDNRLVVYIYRSSELSSDEWKQVRGALPSINPYLIGELGLSSSQHDYTVDTATLDALAGSFDAYWLFDDGTQRIWDSLIRNLNERNMRFAGGVIPGDDREQENGAYMDPRGTKTFREIWELQLNSQLDWVNITTWNDAVERTDIKANTDWNTTRQDINAYYSAKLRGTSPTQSSAQLYLTSPDFVTISESVEAEALLIHQGNESLELAIQLVDSEGKVHGNTVFKTVPPGEITDVTTKFTVSEFPAQRFLRAQAWTLDSDKAPVQQVTSAPILIYESIDGVSPYLRKHYYSIPAAKRLNKDVNLQLTDSPVTHPDSARARVSIDESTKVRFIEIIQNCRSAGTVIDSQNIDLSVPFKPYVAVGNQSISASAHGFYLARVIDNEERVGYSDPIFFS